MEVPLVFSEQRLREEVPSAKLYLQPICAFRPANSCLTQSWSRILLNSHEGQNQKYGLLFLLSSPGLQVQWGIILPSSAFSALLKKKEV